MNIAAFYRHLFLVFILLFIGGSLRLRAQIITTLANIDTVKGFTGDGGAAPYAKFNGPEGVAVDADDNIYIADVYNNRIRKIDIYGNVTTFAGTGVAGYGGDGGLATKAKLNNPSYVTTDVNGNVYISDTKNNRVRKVTVNGIITTIAGKGTIGFSGDGGLATAAELNTPYGIAFDVEGNLYIAGNARIRKVNIKGGISSVAGIGVLGYTGDGGPAIDAKFGLLYGMTVDKTGNVYVADMLNHDVRKIEPSGIISTYAGNAANYSTNPNVTGDGGPATSATIVAPVDIKFDQEGNMYITENDKCHIRKVDSAGIISTIAGNGKLGHAGDGGSALKAELDAPYGLGVDSKGNLYFTEADHDLRFIFTSAAYNFPIKVFPNPTFNGRFKIFFSSVYEENVNIEILSMSGQRVFKDEVATNRDLSIYLEPTGIYYIYGKSAHGKWRGEVSVVH